MSEAPKDGLDKILESAIPFLSNSTSVTGSESQNNITLNGKDRKGDRHQEEIKEDEYSQRIWVDLSKQVEAEIGVMKAIMKLLKKKKRKLRSFICRYTTKDLNSKSRNKVHPGTSNGLNTETTIRSEDCLMPHSPPAPTKFSPDLPKDLYASNQASEKSPSTENFYNAQLKLLLSSTGKPTSNSHENSQRIIFAALNHDFTKYAKTVQNFALHLNYSYDFVPANPLLLFASRWAFTSHTEQVVRYISRKRRAWKKASKLHYEEYKSEFEGWKRRKTEPEVESKAKAEKRVDIYGHNTLDLDHNTCKLIYEIC